MKVTFIHHSSFCVEIEDKVFLFDYFRGGRLADFTFSGVVPEFPRETQIYVFSSHQHQDHFDPEVLQWTKEYPNIRYIFAKQIKLSDNYLAKKGIDPGVKERISYMKANDSLEFSGITVETLPSTDEGVAYLVSYAGKTIYHAGDLHWWHWEGEDDIFNEYQEKTYKRQIEKLAERHIDVAFVVIDPRLDAAVYWGIDCFMELVRADHVIPMHLWQNYGLITQYKALPENADVQERILEVERENQVFEF